MAAWKLDDVGTKPIASNPSRARGGNELILATGDESATERGIRSAKVAVRTQKLTEADDALSQSADMGRGRKTSG
jgi:hypothetical protein